MSDECCDSNDSAGSAATINSWVAEKTNNKVREIVPVSAINALTRLILVNAVYFKGDWQKTFDVADTKDQEFHVSASETATVKMMFMKAKFYYGVNHDLKCEAIELPYTGDTLSMFVLLPDQSTTNLSELEKTLTSDDLMSVTEKFRMMFQEVHVWLPKFKLDEKLSLAKVLSGECVTFYLTKEFLFYLYSSLRGMILISVLFWF